MGKCVSKDEYVLAERQKYAEHALSIDIRTFYDFKEFCGSGHYGIVTRAVSYQDSSKEYAIKRIRKEIISNYQEIRKEVLILCELSHPNIIKIYETFEDSSYFYIVMQYCSGGTLASKIAEVKRFDEAKAAGLIKQIIRAVRYLHSKGICHRDIKPENLLFSSTKEKSKLKLIDFGLSHKKSKNLSKSMKSLVGTLYYVAPEVIDKNYNEKCDIWSIGVIMYVLLSGSLPFYSENKEVLFHSIKNTSLSFPADIWSQISKDAKELLTRLLCKNPVNRITIEEAFNHSWFSHHFTEENTQSCNECYSTYATKEMVSRKILNFMLNSLNYQSISIAQKKIDNNHEETMTIAQFEHITNIKLKIEDESTLINPKKIMQEALWAKQHLNEEKIWKAFCSCDVLGKKSITFAKFVEAMEILEKKKIANKNLFSGKIGYNLEDLMNIYEKGKLLPN